MAGERLVSGTVVPFGAVMAGNRFVGGRVKRPVGASSAPPPGSGEYGANLHDGFTWVLQEPTGPVVSVTSASQFTAAIAAATVNDGRIIDGGGLTFTISQIELPAVSVLTTIRNVTLVGGRIYKGNTGKWRLRNCDISAGVPSNNVKGSGGGFFDLDGCRLHNAVNTGFLMYPHDDVVIRNCRIYSNGSNANQDHGIYCGVGSRMLVYNTAFYNNQAYQVQFYPHYHGALFVCCTMYGGVTRGGVVFGSENSDPASDLRMIGCVAANSPLLGFQQYNTTGPIVLEDCIGWNNAAGDLDSFSSSVTVTRFRHGDPKFVNPSTGDFSPGTGSVLIGVIDPSLYNYVPPTDINGKTRVTADAGAFAA